jgi:hypothetical protein
MQNMYFTRVMEFATGYYCMPKKIKEACYRAWLIRLIDTGECYAMEMNVKISKIMRISK